MNKKKIIIASLASIAVAVPVATALAITAIPKEDTPSSTYMLSFKDDPEKQQYLNFLRDQVAEVFKEYKAEHPGYKGLNLEFINLSRAPKPGDINFFTELDKSLKDINPNLSFTMTQWSPITMKRGYNDRNVDMVSMYWSPDYNDIGTWLTYMFSDYQVPNLWPAVEAALNNEAGMAAFNKTGWIASLRTELEQLRYTFTKKDGTKVTVQMVDPTTHKAVTTSDIHQYISQGASLVSLMTVIGNGISSWSNEVQNQVMGFTNYENKPMLSDQKLVNQETKLYQNYNGGIEGFGDSKLNEFLNYLTSFNTNIPFVQDGPSTKTISLVRNGLHAPNNSQSYLNQRDWYATDEFLKNRGNQVNIWTSINQISNNNSPFNAAFTKSSNGQSFEALFSPLVSWSTIGDFYYNPHGGEVNAGSDYQAQLLPQGTSSELAQIESDIDQLRTLAPDQDKVLSLNIRPIPWVDYKGNPLKDENGKIRYLSPQDYWAGFKSYDRSLQTHYSSNDYFIDLTRFDIEKTLNDQRNQERITDPNSTKPFYIHFQDHIDLPGKNIVDILCMQYFSALPAFEPKVQNITDDAKFQKISGIDLSGGGDSVLNEDPKIMSQFYGCGDGVSIYSEIRYASPYRISSISDTSYVYELNQSFFDCFTAKANASTFEQQSDNYTSFKMHDTIKGQQVSKIPRIKFNYSAAYNDQVAIEQFIAGEIDTSVIPQSRKVEIVTNKKYESSLYEPETLKVNQTNLIPYNTDVLQKNKKGNLILQKGTLADISTDKYGNLVFNNGAEPIVKDRVTPGYYDLIVKNFFTPIDGTDEHGNLLPAIDRSSAIIKTAINDLVNWFSLTSVVYPTESKVMQNSFLPYGVCNMYYNVNGSPIQDVSEDRAKYWSLSAYKAGQVPTGFTNLQSDGKQIKYGNTPGGLVEWTWNDLILDWSARLKGGKK